MKLDKTLNFKKVRCVKGYDDCLEIGKEYEVIDISVEIKVKDDEGNFLYWESDYFEPVLDSAENPLQDMKLTPEFEAVESKFKVGDKVYYGSEPDVLTILEFDVDGWARMDSWAGFVDSSRLCHATPENYERLQATFTDIEFEQPPKPLTGSDLARAMLDKGWKYVPCYMSNTSDKNAVELDDCGVIYTVNHNGNFGDGYGEIWCHAVPFDPRTGEPLTESILND